MIIKGVRRREGDMLHWISVLFASLRRLVIVYGLVLGYENDHCKKKCAPKTRATLAMPNILVCVVCPSLFVVCVWTFLCPD